MKRKNTIYLADQKLLVTELSGELDQHDVTEWQHSLESTLQQLQADTKFKMLVDLHGFKAVNFEVHKQFREVIPRTLAAHGWYTGYLRMFPETKVNISSTDNIYCVAAAHVHHDETKIRNYSENYTMRNEGFFTDATVARTWIDKIEVQ